MEENKQTKKYPWLPGSVFFAVALLYHELILHFFGIAKSVSGLGLVLIFSVALGTLFSALVNLFPHRKAVRICCIILMVLWCVLLCIEFICKQYYKIFYGVGYILSMSESVATGFGDIALYLTGKYSWFIALSILPLIAFIIFRKKIIPDERCGVKVSLVLLAVFLVFQAAGTAMSYLGNAREYYTYNFSANPSVPRFGLATTVRLELQYDLFGTPAIPAEQSQSIEEETEESKINDEPNALDIDFAAIAAGTENSNIQSLANYFSGKKASRKNEYTGLFEGKNLIVITAESFSYGIIDEEATPTLYKLTHNGFVLNDFYQPNWTQSTTGGEFSIMTGVIPTWINDHVAMYVSADDSMPFALGNMFRSAGYDTYAFHNSSYDYYDRDITHPNLGYEYKGVGNGLVLQTGTNGNWPASDLELAQVTLQDIIDQSKSSGTPFHTYYMAVSGHGNYGWKHACAEMHQEEAERLYPDYSPYLQSYCAANLEIEYMLTYIMETLEAEGILNDTVICMCTDHYPYPLVTESGTDYYDELMGFDSDENDMIRYKNAGILYCASMEEPVNIDIPCSSIDLAPTLYNLFNLPYDSRLLSGHDINAQNYTDTAASTCMPLVVFRTDFGYSWKTVAGSYDSKDGSFTLNSGMTVSDTYVELVNNIVNQKFSFAKSLIANDFYSYCVE